ncbi:uncharacterized protein LOC123529784 [Mercenaria mercenaria]|uniref:uncharacterized protein LOC123529784 n=1 Tax=Mercenaria mercenaria TaxID=6596 RepID=UPI00234F95B9|nr:uncharacterized protein LOC123529784 [Mercenaria mercenaria]
MSGPPSQCTNCGEWSACDEETGQCSRQECPLLTTVANGTVLGNMNDFGAKKIVRCNTGYFEITGTHSLKCSAEGKWTRNDRDPHCQKCPDADQMIQFPWSQSYKLKFYKTRTTQQDANDTCDREGAHLVRIDKWWKLQYIRSIRNTCFDLEKDSKKYWTDGRKDEIWKYSNGSNVPMDEMYWNQKSNGTGNRNCIRMKQRLLALSCNKKLSFICEFD